jgi:hypothetical protein
LSLSLRLSCEAEDNERKEQEPVFHRVFLLLKRVSPEKPVRDGRDYTPGADHWQSEIQGSPGISFEMQTDLSASTEIATYR